MTEKERGHRVPNRICASCGEEKPAFKFKRKLTLAQTRARGGIGKHRMEIVSKNCTECRAAKSKPIKAKTPKELQNMNADGVISDFELRVRLQTHKDRGKFNMKQGVAKSWDNRFALAWSFYIYACDTELKRSQAALRHLRRDNNKPELLDFYTAYIQALHNAKLTMQSNARKRIPPKTPKNTLNPSTHQITQTHAPLACNYPRYISDSLRRDLYARWDAVLTNDQQSGRRIEPEAVFWREPEENGDIVSPLTKEKANEDQYE
jgi:hypothetical protein